MASAKETPRQRMVGMMYLVLTALLALQVSSSLIYKFQYLNESLEKASAENESWNGLKLKRIEEEIEKRGNKNIEVDLLKSAKLIRTESQKTVAYIENLKQQLIKESGGIDAEGNLKGAKEETKVEVIMIGANKNGKAYELKNKLNDFIKFMNKNGANYSPMALDGKEDPLFKNKEDQKNKDYAELNFGQTPLVASLAILSEYQSRITSMQTTSITALGENIGIGDFMVDKMIPMVSPASKIVAAGTKYEANLFMVGTSSTLKPQMEFNSNAVAVDNNGVGKVSFTASGGNYINGLAKKVWTGKIKSKTPDGRDTTYTITEEYFVAQPVIDVQAKAVNNLYRNCGNKLKIKVPALGALYNPQFSATGATLTNGSSKEDVTIVPTGSRVTVKVNSGGNYIGELNYGVQLIPLPTIEVKANSSKVDFVKGVEAGKLRTIQVTAIADKAFKEFLPDDAIYTISKVKVRIARNRTAMMQQDYSSGSINLGQIAAELRTNDIVLVEVLEVKRRNYKGEWEIVNIPDSQKTFLIPIK